MKNYKIYLVNIIAGLLLLPLSSVIASPSKWVELSSIEKDVLKKHSSKWDGYGGKKQKGLLKAVSKKIKGLNTFKIWFNKLSASERKEFTKNKKEMSSKKFKKYVDGLMKKHGNPNRK